MSVSYLHLFRQGENLLTLLRIAAFQKQNKKGKVKISETYLEETVPAINSDLIKDYIIHTGGLPSNYKGVIPCHMFPKWGFSILAKTLLNLPYDMSRILNAGAKIEIYKELPANEDLHLKARLADIDDNGSRVIFRQHLITGTESAPCALSCEVTTIIPLMKKKDAKKEKIRIPEKVHEIGILNLNDKMGFEFAMLTGDFNPIHWLKPFANMAGFPNVILHGFSTMARTIEILNERVLCKDVRALKTFEARFIKPVVLPKILKVYVNHDEGKIFAGMAKNGEAYIEGKYTSNRT